MRKIVCGLLFVVCGFACTAQQKTITFVKKEKANKKLTKKLPAEATIIYKDKRTDYVLIIASNDSVLTCKLFVPHFDTVVTEKYIPYADRNMENMLNPGQTKDWEEQKHDFATYYKDTVRIKMSEVKKISFMINNSENSINKTATVVTVIFGLTFIIGLDALIQTDTLVGSATVPSIVTLTGLAGMIIVGKFTDNIYSKTIRTRKWKIVI